MPVLSCVVCCDLVNVFKNISDEQEKSDIFLFHSDHDQLNNNRKIYCQK